MQYAGIIYDDTAAAPGLCLSFYTQGCPIQCAGC
jgi:pyruvate-formate lyase-activating enzyme